MTCTPITLPGGQRAIVCGPTKRCKCGKRGMLLCDWKVPGKRSGTCDRAICKGCATPVAEGKDLCPEHAKAFEAWKAGRVAQ